MKQTLKIAASIATVAACAAASKPVQAQDTGLIPVRAKIGVFMPQGSGKDFAGSTNFNGEVDVAIPQLGLGKTFVTAGYTQGSRNGGKVRVIPVTLTRMFSPPNPVSGVTGNVYFGAGIGPYFVRADNGVTSDSKVTIGGFGVVGYQFPNPYFVEAKYHVAGKVNGIAPNGFALMIGRRF